MEQNINVEQIQCLSDKGKKRLRKWWKPNFGDIYYHVEATYNQIVVINNHDNDGNINAFCENTFPLLSIGQMIEFLDEEYQKGNKFSLSIERGANGWILWESGDEEIELCDALWGSVKEILEQDGKER